MALDQYLGEIQQHTAPAKAGMDSAYQGLAQASGDAATLPYKLKEALQQKLNYNEDIIGQQSNALADYIAAPAESRAKHEGVWNPFQREALVARDRATAYQPYNMLTGILGQRMGEVSDIVGQGVAGWQGVIQQAQALAQLAQQTYQQAWQEYTQAAGMQQDDENAASAQSRWEQEFGLEKEKFDWSKQMDLKKGSGGGGATGSAYDTLSPEAQKVVDFYALKYLNNESIEGVPPQYERAIFERAAQIGAQKSAAQSKVTSGKEMEDYLYGQAAGQKFSVVQDTLTKPLSNVASMLNPLQTIWNSFKGK